MDLRFPKYSKSLNFLAGACALALVLALEPLMYRAFEGLARIFPRQFYSQGASPSESFFISDKAFKSYLHEKFPKESLPELQERALRAKPRLFFIEQPPGYSRALIFLALCAAALAAALLYKTPSARRLFIRRTKYLFGVFLALLAAIAFFVGARRTVEYWMESRTIASRDAPTLLKDLHKILEDYQSGIEIHRHEYTMRFWKKPVVIIIPYAKGEKELEGLEVQALKTGHPTPVQMSEIIGQILAKVSAILDSTPAQDAYLDKKFIGRTYPAFTRREALTEWQKRLLLEKQACERGFYTSYQIDFLVRKRRERIEIREVLLQGLICSALSFCFLRRRRRGRPAA